MGFRELAFRNFDKLCKNPYVETGWNFIHIKYYHLELVLEDTNDEIEDYNDKLETKEQQLRTKYGMMEGALESMQASTRALDNLSNNSGN